MCGIAGIYNFRTSDRVGQGTFNRMVETLVHRGPDSGGTYLKGPVCLGHRRLSILDLNPRSGQPMTSSDGRFTLVYNGEIYNYLELRDDLHSDGYSFRTDSDTEVLLALYAKEGEQCVHRLNGMFAFAIWDERERCLFLARDRLGIKPLYYAETSGGLVFASEIKALLALKEVEPKVALPLIDTFMTFGYVPGSSTLFQGIEKLPAGYSLEIRSQGLKRNQYWNIDYQPNHTRPTSKTAAELKSLLLDSVRIHLRSDVPVGVFLSGGLDSSAMVALLSEAGVQELKTFCVGYDEGGGYDETFYADIVAKHFKTDHHVLHVNPEQFVQFIPEYVWYMDEPVTEAAAISLYFVARLLKQHVTVALSGEGADELFGGYDIYRYMQWIEMFRKIPAPLRVNVLEVMLAQLRHPKIKKYLSLAKIPLRERYLGVSLHDGAYKEQIYTSQYWDLLSKSGGPSNPYLSWFEQVKDHDELTQMLYSDMKGWLVDDLLIKADKMTMANSVELRVPFLDYRVVEYAATIPSNQKIHHGSVKWILKQALAAQLPKEILRRKKVGFPTPLRLMFQRDLSEYLSDVLLSDRCSDRGYFSSARVEALIAEHVRGVRDHHKVLWQLIVLEEWHRRFIDAPSSVPCSHEVVIS